MYQTFNFLKQWSTIFSIDQCIETTFTRESAANFNNIYVCFWVFSLIYIAAIGRQTLNFASTLTDSENFPVGHCAAFFFRHTKFIEL